MHIVFFVNVWEIKILCTIFVGDFGIRNEKEVWFKKIFQKRYKFLRSNLLKCP